MIRFLWFLCLVLFTLSTGCEWASRTFTDHRIQGDDEQIYLSTIEEYPDRATWYFILKAPYPVTKDYSNKILTAHTQYQYQSPDELYPPGFRDTPYRNTRRTYDPNNDTWGLDHRYQHFAYFRFTNDFKRAFPVGGYNGGVTRPYKWVYDLVTGVMNIKLEWGDQALDKEDAIVWGLEDSFEAPDTTTLFDSIGWSIEFGAPIYNGRAVCAYDPSNVPCPDQSFRPFLCLDRSADRDPLEPHQGMECYPYFAKVLDESTFVCWAWSEEDGERIAKKVRCPQDRTPYWNGRVKLDLPDLEVNGESEGQSEGFMSFQEAEPLY